MTTAVAAEPALSTEQIAAFKRDGFLILRSVIEPAYIDAWRRQFWDHLGESETDPSTWQKRSYTMRDFAIQPESIQLQSHPRMRAIVQQLGGGEFTGGGAAAPLVAWPARRTDWNITPWGHVDGYPPTGWHPFMLSATTYAYDTPSMGGSFVYWPQSHISTHQYFREHPDQIDGQFSREPGFNWGAQNPFCLRAPLPQQEFTANAGDVILWHAFLVHTGSANLMHTPRVAFFSRFGHRRQQEFKYEVPEDLWKYWAI